MMLVGLVLILLTAALSSLFFSCYRKCAPNQALLILRRGATGSQDSNLRILVGKGAFVFSPARQHHYLSLELMPLNVHPVSLMCTRDQVPVKVFAQAHIKIPAKEDAIAHAADWFLNKSTEQVKFEARELLVEGMRSVISELDYHEFQLDYKLVSVRTISQTSLDFENMGLVVSTFGIYDIQKIVPDEPRPHGI